MFYIIFIDINIIKYIIAKIRKKQLGRFNVTSEKYIELTNEHIEKINSLNLGVHINHAAYDILKIVQNSESDLELTVDQAVDMYCREHISAYKHCVDAVDMVAEKTGVSHLQATSVVSQLMGMGEHLWRKSYTDYYLNKYIGDNAPRSSKARA